MIIKQDIEEAIKSKQVILEGHKALLQQSKELIQFAEEQIFHSEGKIEIVQKEIQQLKSFLQMEVEAVNFPERGTTYYMADSDGSVCYDVWGCSHRDKQRFRTGNFSLTREGARLISEKYLKYGRFFFSLSNEEIENWIAEKTKKQESV